MKHWSIDEKHKINFVWKSRYDHNIPFVMLKLWSLNCDDILSRATKHDILLNKLPSSVFCLFSERFHQNMTWLIGHFGDLSTTRQQTRHCVKWARLYYSCFESNLFRRWSFVNLFLDKIFFCNRNFETHLKQYKGYERVGL